MFVTIVMLMIKKMDFREIWHYNFWKYPSLRGSKILAEKYRHVASCIIFFHFELTNLIRSKWSEFRNTRYMHSLFPKLNLTILPETMLFLSQWQQIFSVNSKKKNV